MSAVGTYVHYVRSGVQAHCRATALNINIHSCFDNMFPFCFRSEMLDSETALHVFAPRAQRAWQHEEEILAQPVCLTVTLYILI
jgi:hypothetical protein